MGLGLIAALILTYGVASDVIFLSFCRALPRDRSADRHLLFLTSRGAGPAFVSLVLYYLMLFAPGRSSVFYVACVGTTFIVLLAVGMRELPALVVSYRWALRSGRFLLQRARRTPPIMATLVLLSLGVFFGLAYPIVEHDSLSAAVEARIMARDHTMVNYLAVGLPDTVSGYYMENFRTPFLQLLYVWFALLGGESMDLLIRTVSPLYGLLCVVLVGEIVRRLRGAATWAGYLVASTPIFFYMSYNNGIDTARLFLSLAALAWFAELVKRPGACWPLTPVVGFTAGLALYSHLLGSLSLAGAGLALLGARRWRVPRKLMAGAVVVVLAFVTGAQIHYLINPNTAALLARSFGVQKAESAAAGAMSRSPQLTVGEQEMHDLVRASRREAGEELARFMPGSEAVLEARGQTGGLRKLLFGRLQMLTGLEYFGFLFVLFWVGVFLRMRGGPWRSGERVLLLAALVACAVILSGLRKLSWSNPRYIASIVPIVACFAAPVALRLKRVVPRSVPDRLRSWVIVLFLAGPVLLVTSVRGAKVEITNPGDFYPKFRSFAWVRAGLARPREGLRTLWNEYAGIRNTLRYAFSDDLTKLKHSHDYFAGVSYVNEFTPAESKVLLLRDARFFYYGKRRAAVWYSPEIDAAWYQRIANGNLLLSYLCESGFTHVLSDAYSETQGGYLNSSLGQILENARNSGLLYRYRSARVYLLLCGNARELREYVQDAALSVPPSPPPLQHSP